MDKSKAAASHYAEAARSRRPGLSVCASKDNPGVTSRQAILALTELCRLSGDSPWLFPARTMSKATTTHIHLGTLNAAASARLRPTLVGTGPFCIHDLRRTTCKQLEALGTASVVAERCLNHRISGIYNRHDYLNERKEALQS